MSRFDLTKYVAPWKFRREQLEQRVAALRRRDGDHCRRCRRPIRFDLPHGHDKGPFVQHLASEGDDQPAALDNFCLCHGRCNAAGADNTDEVTERIRRRNEAALLSSSRGTRRRRSRQA